MSVGPVPRIPIGIGPPNTLPVAVTSLPTSEGGTDLTTVTGVAFRVWDPDGLEVDGGWSGAVAPGATPTSASVYHAFTGSELAREGIWKVAPVLTVPGGTVPVEHVDVQAVRIP